MEIATKDRWKIKPMSQPHKLDVELYIDEQEFQKIKLGFVPASMDDKWFDYYLEGWLHIHRSWTGIQIFKCKIEQIDSNDYMIKDVYVERDKEIYKQDNDDTDKYNFQSYIKFLTQRKILNPIIDGVLGLIVGDALGVPVEFVKRSQLKDSPVVNMTGFGTHNQPVGTWSDDSSLTLCLAEQLTQELDIQNIGKSFVDWLYKNKWTPHGQVFDIGISTRLALDRIKNGEKAEFAGNFEESSNGNGSLMRILPLFLETRKIRNSKEKYELVKKISSITHAHVRSTLSCFYYLEMGRFILDGYDSMESYQKANEVFLRLTDELNIPAGELKHFERLTNGDIHQLREDKIFSETYVIYTLEASVWCLLTTDNYREAVLKAVNLGYDTDTTAAMTGGLAGLIYSCKNIPGKWMEQIARLEDIEELAERLGKKFSEEWNL